MNTNSFQTSLSNNDEKENRRIIDIQCKIKLKDTRSSLVKKNKKIFPNFFKFYFYCLLVIYKCKISRSFTT